MFFHRAAVASAASALALSGLVAPTSAQNLAVGDSICIEGYIMDNFCIGLGVLLDNQSVVTLEEPDKHSYHCLLDVGKCVDSGYQVLIDNPNDGDFCQGFRFDSTGNADVRSLGQSLGSSSSSCTTCTSDAADAPSKGFRATVRGTVTALGDAGSPADVTVTGLDVEGAGCGSDGTVASNLQLPPIAASCAVGFVAPVVEDPATTDPPPSDSAGGGDADSATSFPLQLPMSYEISRKMIMEYGVNIDAAAADVDGDTISVRVTYDTDDEDAWVAFAFSNDDKMIDSNAVIGFPGQGYPPKKYFLGGYTADVVTVMDIEDQTLINAAVERTDDGKTVLQFTKLLNEDGEVEIVDDGRTDNNFLWAHGTSSELAYHGFNNRGSFRLMVDGNMKAGTSPGGIQFLRSKTLSDKVTAEYGVNIDPDAEGLGDTMSVRVTYEGEGYVGFAVSNDNKMLNAEAVIGLPGLGAQKYFLGGYQKELVVPMDEAKQTLINPSIEQADGTTVLRFTKLLKEEGEIEIMKEGANNFLWAMGMNNELMYHGFDNRGHFALALDGSEPVKDDPTPSPTRMPIAAPPASPDVGVEVGDEICVTGYIMDRFCIDRGTLLDNPSVRTLLGPEQHSFHCLLDIGRCVDSGYEVLIDPLEGDAEYCVGYRADANGFNMLTDLAKSLGSTRGCRECTGTMDEQRRGFRATVRGTVTAPGDAASPAQIAVSEVLESTEGCGEDEVRFPLSAAMCAPSAAGDGAAGVDCAADFQFSTDLSPGVLSMEYTVINPEEGGDDGEDASGVLRARLTYNGEGYVALGFSTTGRMVGSEAVIGIPGSVPEKYNLGGFTVDAVQPMIPKRQTLMDAEVVQEDGKTIMTFTKFLKEDGEIPINPVGANQFLWAVGGPSLAYHGSTRAPFMLDLQTCVDGARGGSIIRQQEGPSRDQRMWKAHGIMALVAWGFLTPMAIASSWLRDLIGGPLWFKIHMFFNSMTFVLTIAFFSVAVAQFNRTDTPHFQGGLPSSSHQRMGLAMFILVFIQVIGGCARPHLPPEAPPAKDPSDSAENGEEKEQPEKAKKSTVRVVWEVFHKATGLALLGCGLWQINRGLELYAMKNYPEFITQTAFWIWIGVFLGLALVLTLFSKVRGRN